MTAPAHVKETWCEFEHESLAEVLRAQGYSSSNAAAILRSWYRHDGALDEWTQRRIGPRLSAYLHSTIGAVQSRVIHRHVSADGTIKLLIECAGGGKTESVLMPAYRAGRAMACVSSQIGCAMGCEFCASTKSGLERDLTAGEIVEQFVHLQNEARLQNRRITSLVFMGMGEPMHNLAAVIPATKRIAHPDMGAVGWRQVTISTVGIIPGIESLANADLNVHLALSLHAADDTLRSQIVPMNRKYDIAATLSAARAFYERTGRIVTIEWCLIEDVNDGIDQANKLAGLLREHDFLRGAHVNVIPFNPIAPGPRGREFRRPTSIKVKLFIEQLQLHNVVCHRRDTRGDDVSAACGQLRRNHLPVVHG